MKARKLIRMDSPGRPPRLTQLLNYVNTTVNRKGKIVNFSLGLMQCLLSEATKQVRPSGGQSVSQKTGMLCLVEPTGNEV